MMSPPALAPRHLSRISSCWKRGAEALNQRRWAQVHDVRLLVTQSPSRSILERYREKLDAKAREEGHADMDALKSAYAEKVQSLRKTAGMPHPGSPALATEQYRQRSEPAPTCNSIRAHKTRGANIKPLDAILDLPKARTLPVAELTAIWRLRHAEQVDSLCAVIPAHTFEVMQTTARSAPQFVLPVPHGVRGAEMHFLQWTWDPATRTSTVLFTQLAEYKARGEYASPHTTVTHYVDLAPDKGVVLMQGRVMADRGVGADDARWLIMCLQRFYGGWDGVGMEGANEGAIERAAERKRLLEWFAKGDERFSVDRLLEEAEKLG